MADSKVNICNQALIMLGSTTISSLDESNKRAKECSVQFDPCRKALLRRHNWGFARARRDLAKLSETPPFGFDYYFQLPSDLLRLRKVIREDGGLFDDRYALEGDRIAIDIDPCRIIYTRDVTTPKHFDPLFTKTLAAWIAWEISLSIAGSNTKRELMGQTLEYYLDTAESIDASEGKEHIEPTANYLQAR